jgi:hypothetical protein
MISLEDDEILKEYLNTPDKKAKWLIRIRYLYILWIIFIILGILFILIYYLIN